MELTESEQKVWAAVYAASYVSHLSISSFGSDQRTSTAVYVADQAVKDLRKFRKENEK